MLVPITSIIRGCPNKAGRSNFDNNKIAISLTMKISEELRYGRLHSNSLGLINFDDSLTNCDILHWSIRCRAKSVTLPETTRRRQMGGSI